MLPHCPNMMCLSSFSSHSLGTCNLSQSFRWWRTHFCSTNQSPQACTPWSMMPVGDIFKINWFLHLQGRFEHLEWWFACYRQENLLLLQHISHYCTCTNDNCTLQYIMAEMRGGGAYTGVSTLTVVYGI